MDRFHDGQNVRLRFLLLGTYLHAADDGASVTLDERRASMNAAWTVHIYHSGAVEGEGDGDGDDPYLFLHSAAYGGYLAATATPARIGDHGFRVELRNYDQPEVEAIEWRAVGSGFADDVVLLLSFTGRYLRANGPPRQRPAIDDARPEVVDSWGLLRFMGRSVFSLRDDLALRVAVDMQNQNVAMCVRAGRYGRLTPLVVDLPHGGGIREIVIFLAATPDPIYAALHSIFAASFSRNCTTTVRFNSSNDIIAADRNARALTMYTTPTNSRSNYQLSVSQAIEAIRLGLRIRNFGSALTELTEYLYLLGQREGSVSINIKWMMVLGPEAWLSRPDSRICTPLGHLSDAFPYEVLSIYPSSLKMLRILLNINPIRAALNSIFVGSLLRNCTTAVELSSDDAVIASDRNAGALTVYSAATANSRNNYQFNVSQAIEAFRLGVWISNLGSALTELDDHLTGAAEWVEETTGYLDILGEFELLGDGRVTRLIHQSAQVSRGIANVMRRTSIAVSFGARACSLIGFRLQRLHPDAQVGQTDEVPCAPMIRISSLEDVDAVADDWWDDGQLVVAEVTADMGRAEATEIYRRFVARGAYDLIRDSTVLKSKVQAPEESWEFVRYSVVIVV